jgi:hypothetical protein
MSGPRDRTCHRNSTCIQTALPTGCNPETRGRISARPVGLCFPMPSLEHSVFDDVDDAAEERAMEEAEAAFAAGRVISHEAMKKWLASWGTPGELPPPQVGS